MEAIVSKFRQSRLTRREYCEREGITVHMLDYYQRRLSKLSERDSSAKAKPSRPESRMPRLARVELRSETIAAVTPTGFTMTVCNGRRIEVNGWGYRDQDLARLIQVVERA